MITLECKTGTEEITDETVSALQTKWPSRDVRAELQKAHLWLLRHKSGRPVNVWRFVDNWLKRAPAVRVPPTVVNAWWTTDERTINQGLALGLSARPGESMPQFRERIANHMKGGTNVKAA